MEINVNFVLFEELEKKPNHCGVETHVVIIRECKDPGSAFEDGGADLDLSE